MATIQAALDQRATPAYAKQCIAKLMVAFEPNTKATPDEVRLRAMVWLEACGDLSDALWAEATTECIRGMKWMPKPSEFRATVDLKRDRLRRQLDRLKRMASSFSGPQPVREPEPREVRKRTMRDTFRKIGQPAKAAVHEYALAHYEGRDVEEWAREFPATGTVSA